MGDSVRMANINIKISEEIHNMIRHERIDTGKGNGEIIEDAIKFYFKSKEGKVHMVNDTPSEISIPLDED